MPQCKDCKNSFGFFELKNGICKSCLNKKTPPCVGCGKNFEQSQLSDGYCISCIDKKKREQKAKELASISETKLKSIILTTETHPNIEITERIEIISAECVFGMNIFKDLFAGVRDIVGGRSKASEGVLSDARKEVLKGLREEAFHLEADAVVGVDLNYSEFSGGGKSMLFVVATGTAVKMKYNDAINTDS